MQFLITVDFLILVVLRINMFGYMKPFKKYSAQGPCMRLNISVLFQRLSDVLRNRQSRFFSDNHHVKPLRWLIVNNTEKKIYVHSFKNKIFIL